METDSLSPALNTFMFLSIAETRISRCIRLPSQRFRIYRVHYPFFILFRRKVKSCDERSFRKNGLTPSGITSFCSCLWKNWFWWDEKMNVMRCSICNPHVSGKNKVHGKLPYKRISRNKFQRMGKKKLADILQFLKDIRWLPFILFPTTPDISHDIFSPSFWSPLPFGKKLEALSNPTAGQMRDDLDLREPLGIGKAMIHFGSWFKHDCGKPTVLSIFASKTNIHRKLLLFRLGNLWNWGIDSVFW